MDFKLAQEAANILKPKFKRLRIPQGTYDMETVFLLFIKYLDILQSSGEEEFEILPSISKLFSHGCLDPTPFGRHSFADIASAAYF